MAIIRFPVFHDMPVAFREIDRMKRDMDRLFGSFMRGGPLSAMTGSGVFPALNLSEDDDKVFVNAELPGIKPEDLDISVIGDTLTLRGERKADEGSEGSYHRRERKMGRFHKAVTLPYAVNPEDVEASFKDGVLSIVMKKAESAKPKKITIKAA